MKFTTLLSSILSFVSVVAASCVASGSDNLQIIALSNRPNGWTAAMPIVVGDVFPESVDPAGRVSFSGNLLNNDGTNTGAGIWSYLNGNLATILSPDAVVDVGGQQTAFTNGVYGLGMPVNGKQFFRGYYNSATLGSVDGYWLAQAPANPQKVFVPGDQISTNEEFLFSYSSSDENRSAGGRLVFHSLTRHPGDTYSIYRQGLWYVDTDGVPQVMAVAGQTMPGLPAGQVLNGVGGGTMFGNVLMTELGDAGFEAIYVDSATMQFAGQGIWVRKVNGDLQSIVKSNDQINLNGQLVNVQPASEGLMLNNVGQIAFRGIVNSSTTSQYPVDAIWLQEANGARRLVAQAGVDVPPALLNTVISSFSSDRFTFTNFLNDRGELAFAASFTHPSPAPPPIQQGASFSTADVGPVIPIYGQGIWTDNHGDLNLVVRSGDLLPGADRPIVWAEPLALNNNGQLLFRGATVDIFPTPAAAQFGIWIRDPDGTFRLVLKTGEQVDVAPGSAVDLRTVSFFSTASDSALPGGHVSFNDKGQVLLTAYFTDGSNATMLFNATAVPEPNLAAISVNVLALLALRHSRRQIRVDNRQVQ